MVSKHHPATSSKCWARGVTAGKGTWYPPSTSMQRCQECRGEEVADCRNRAPRSWARRGRGSCQEWRGHGTGRVWGGGRRVGGASSQWQLRAEVWAGGRGPGHQVTHLPAPSPSSVLNGANPGAPPSGQGARWTQAAAEDGAGGLTSGQHHPGQHPPKLLLPKEVSTWCHVWLSRWACHTHRTRPRSGVHS